MFEGLEGGANSGSHDAERLTPLGRLYVIAVVEVPDSRGGAAVMNDERSDQSQPPLI